MSDFKYVAAPWVIALGDEVQLCVWRSEVLSKSQDLYSPVQEHINAYGMQLVEEELLSSDQHIYGKTFKSWFAVASARNLLMAVPE